MKRNGTWRVDETGVEQPLPRLLALRVTSRRSSLGTGCSTFVLLALVALLTGCDAGPRPIRYGRDECAECKMTLVDQHYGAEFISARGRVYTFDDLNCLTAYLRRPGTQAGDGARSVVVDFTRANAFIAADQAWFLHHPGLRSPMGSGLAAFASEAELDLVRRELGGGGRLLRWPDVRSLPP